MAELTLTREQRLDLKARAHHIDPVVLLGSQGLTEAVIKEIDRALKSHELIKVRVPGDDRDEREAMYAQIADQLDAARIQSIGKLLVFWRPLPPDEKARSPKAPARPPVTAKGPALRKTASKATSGEIRRTERKVAPRSTSSSNASGRRGATKPR